MLRRLTDPRKVRCAIQSNTKADLDRDAVQSAAEDTDIAEIAALAARSWSAVRW